MRLTRKSPGKPKIPNNTMDYGINKRYSRAKVPVRVLRGWNPTEPVKLSSLAPPIDGSAIKEGMVIKRVTGAVGGASGKLGFQKSAAADSETSVSFFIAIHDGDSHDVQASGKLVGLDCSDTFEIQTGYFDASQTWLIDDPLTVGADGVIVKAGSGDVVIGYITALGAGTNNTIPYVGMTPPTAVADSSVIQFKTAHTGVKLA